MGGCASLSGQPASPEPEQASHQQRGPGAARRAHRDDSPGPRCVCCDRTREGSAGVVRPGLLCDAHVASIVGGLTQLVRSSVSLDVSKSGCSLECLSGLVQLTHLALRSIRDCMADIDLPRLNALCSLDLAFSKASSADLARFSEFDLVALRADGCAVIADALDCVGGLTTLVELRLADCGDRIDDAALGLLGGLSRLARRDVSRCAVSDNELARGQCALPHLAFVRALPGAASDVEPASPCRPLVKAFGPVQWL